MSSRKLWFITNKNLIIDLFIRVSRFKEFRDNIAISRLKLASLNYIRIKNIKDKRNLFYIRLLRLNTRKIEFIRLKLDEIRFVKS